MTQAWNNFDRRSLCATRSPEIRQSELYFQGDLISVMKKPMFTKFWAKVRDRLFSWMHRRGRNEANVAAIWGVSSIRFSRNSHYWNDVKQFAKAWTSWKSPEMGAVSPMEKPITHRRTVVVVPHAVTPGNRCRNGKWRCDRMRHFVSPAWCLQHVRVYFCRSWSQPTSARRGRNIREISEWKPDRPLQFCKIGRAANMKSVDHMEITDPREPDESILDFQILVRDPKWDEEQWCWICPGANRCFENIRKVGI